MAQGSQYLYTVGPKVEILRILRAPGYVHESQRVQFECNYGMIGPENHIPCMVYAPKFHDRTLSGTSGVDDTKFACPGIPRPLQFW